MIIDAEKFVIAVCSLPANDGVPRCSTVGCAFGFV